MNVLRKLAEQQKNQRGPKIENRILKQTHDMKLAEFLSPITKNLDCCNKKVSEVFGEAISEVDIKALPNSSKFSIPMREKIGSLMKIRNSLKITQDELGRAKVLGVPIQI